MKFQKANTSFFDEQIYFYKSKSITELQTIAPQWAPGKKLKKMFNSEYKGDRKNFKIWLTNPVDLVAKANFWEVQTEVLFTGDIVNDGRVARILNRWDHGEFIDPPMVGILNRQSGQLGFSDGRHRTKVAYLLGC